MNSSIVRNGRTDIAIVGGGPAGAVCAIALARAGVDVCLIVREETRGKGVELVSGRARKMFEHYIATNLWTKTKAIEIAETVSLWGDKRPQTWNAIRNPHGAGFAVERLTLDRALRDTAAGSGVRMLSGFNAQRAARNNGRWQVPLWSPNRTAVLNADRLVLATGRNTRDLLGRTTSIEDRRLAFTATLASPSGIPRYALYLELTQRGWWYGLPHPVSGTFLGYCSSGRRDGRRRSPVASILRSELARTRLMRNLVCPNPEPLIVHGCVAGMRGRHPACGEGWAAVGDAAFAPDPLSGLGCEFAIASGLHAAQALLSSTNSTAMAQYEQSVREFSELHRQQGAMFYAN